MTVTKKRERIVGDEGNIYKHFKLFSYIKRLHFRSFMRKNIYNIGQCPDVFILWKISAGIFSIHFSNYLKFLPTFSFCCTKDNNFVFLATEVPSRSSDRHCIIHGEENWNLWSSWHPRFKRCTICLSLHLKKVEMDIQWAFFFLARVKTFSLSRSH